MPKFKITDTQSGQSLVIDADRAPEQHEVEEIFLSQKQQAPPPQDSVLSKMTQVMSQTPGFGPMQGGKAIPYDPNASIFPIPRIEAQSTLGQIAAAPVNVAGGLVRGAGTVPGLITLPLAGAGRLGQLALGGIFGVPAVAGGLKDVYQGTALGKPGQAVEGALSTLIGGQMIGGGLRGVEPKPAPTPDQTPFAIRGEGNVPLTREDLNAALRSVVDELQARQITAPQEGAVPLPTAVREPSPPTTATAPGPAQPSPPQPAAGPSPLQDVRPAILTMDKRVLVGEQGQVHDDIIAVNKLAPTDIDRRIFVDPKQPNVEISREQLNQMGVPPTEGGTPGRADADQLAAIQEKMSQQAVPDTETLAAKRALEQRLAAMRQQESVVPTQEGAPSDTQSQGRLPGSLPSNRQELRNLPEQGGGAAQAAPNQPVPQEVALPAPGAEAGQTAPLVGERAPSLGQGQGPGVPLAQLDQDWFNALPLKQQELVEQHVAGDTTNDRDFLEKLGLSGQKVEAGLRFFRLRNERAELPTAKQARPSQELYESLPQGDQQAFKDMGLHEETNLGTVVRNLGASKSVLPEHSALARFLDERFGHVLGVQSVDLGKGAADAAHYDPYGQKAYLDIEASDIPLPLKVLEEAAHAATMWQFRFPKNEVEFKASQVIKNLRTEGARKGLTLKEMSFLTGEFDKLMTQRGQTGRAPQAYWDAFDKAGVLRSRSDFLYRLHNDDEFIGGMFADARFRNFLNSWDYGDRGGLFSFVDSVKKLLGVGQDKALDTAFDALINVAEARGGIEGRMGMEGKVLAPPYSRFIGDVQQGAVRGEELRQHEQGAEHRDKNYLRGDRWRYDTDDKVVVWTTDPSQEAKVAVENWLAKRGKEVIDHEIWGIPMSPPPQARAVRDLTRDEWIKQRAAYFSGWSLPSHAGVSEDLANAGVAYGSARLINETWPKALVTRVLGARQDLNFRRTLGAVATQGRLEGLRQHLEDLAAKEEDATKAADYRDRASKVVNVWDLQGSPIRSQEEYVRVRDNPETRAALERHKEWLQPVAEQMHVEVGGKLSPTADPETGAFVNLKALMGTEDEAAVREQMFIGRRGDITSGLRRGTAFGREFKGTGQRYEFDYRKLGERMVKGNYEQSALRKYITALENAGVAIEQKAGAPEPPKTLKGKQLVPRTIELRGVGPGMTRHIKLWLHPDLANEFDGMRKLDSPVQSAAKALVVDTLNDLQVVGLTDALWHVKNQLGAIMTAQGGGGVLADIARKGGGPVTGVPDALGRMVYNAARVLMDTPSVQDEIAQYTLAGAGRGMQVHRGIVGKLSSKVGGPEWLDPNFWTGKAINVIDKAGRVTLNQMYNDLVARGWAKDSMLDRREFVNKMGQYNSQLMGRFSQAAREFGFGPFVVAGKNFNRLAVQRLMLSPGVRAANPATFAQMRMVEGLTLAMSLFVLPGLVNYIRTGSPTGRKGVKWGQIDLGTDDQYGRPKVWDPQTLSLTRRAMSVTGLSALDRAAGQGLSGKDTAFEVGKDVLEAQLRPVVGPAVRGIETALTGRDILTGRPVSRNPFDTGENLKAAAQQLNPMIASELGATGSLPGGERGLLKTAGQAAGFTVGRFPSFKERMDEEVAKLGHQPSVAERVSLTRKIRGEMAETPQEPISRYGGAERRLAHDFSQQDALRERLTDSHQDFLNKYSLTLPGFQEELTLHKVKVPLDRAEADKMAGIYSSRYDKAIAVLETDPVFATESHTRQQLRLNRVLTRAREQARREARGLLRISAAPPPEAP